MLEYLHLQNVGPAPEMELELASRLNVITGDNGLGKSFLLDVVWWALTQTWAREMARPAKGLDEPRISFGFRKGQTHDVSFSWWSPVDQAWRHSGAMRSDQPGVVLYAHVNGGFSTWDPARNYWAPHGISVSSATGRQPSYVFEAHEVWDGLERDGISLCEGLVRDWASWQKERGQAFEQLTKVLEGLSPSSHELLVPGGFARLGFQARDIPTLRMPYGQDVPVLHASAGMRRIIALAYMLVWTWQEHVKASELIEQPPAREITFLIDEIEAHLHPQWQRRVLRSLLGVMGALTGTSDVHVQLVAVTHSPLILVSAEPLFDREQDALFVLDLNRGSSTVRLEQRDFVRRGDPSLWLVSDTFGLRHFRSQEAAEVLDRAAVALESESFGKEQAEALEAELRGVLGDTDPFWVSWRYVGERKGWFSSATESAKGSP
ncbi:MAG: AAA family ATPase [Myxococcales bacterium]|nr:AAA family ATPase [Myxococcales bacterium]